MSTPGRPALWFREKGRDELHPGHSARVEAHRIQFRTEHGVSPNSVLELQLSAPEATGGQGAAEVEISRVDTEPDGFRLEGRLRARR